MKEAILNFISQVGIADLIDIAIIAFVVYKVLQFIRQTRAEQLVKGLLVLLVVMFLSGIFQLYALNWILKNVMQFGVIALVIVFQPELRRALEYVGRSKLLRGKLPAGDKEKTKRVVTSIIKAVDSFSSSKTGALIIIEREVVLNDFAETGVILDSDITPEILENIFYDGAPLHDGAAIVADDKIHAAACVLPLTRNKDLPPELGMRHRAGIGITEVSDAYAIIVSEETGIISIATDGKINRFLDIKSLEKDLLDIYMNEDINLSKGLFKAFERGGKDVKKQ